MISRRDAIKTLIVSVGGSSLLSACGGRATLGAAAPGTAAGASGAALAAAPRFYSAREMAVMSRVSDLLLPRTETPGALDVGVPALLDQLMDEWADAETKAEHRATLAALDARLTARAGGDFVVASEAAAVDALGALDQAAFTDDQAADAAEEVEGYRGLKGLITQAYFATEGGAVQEQGWVGVPGRWDSCLDRAEA